MDPGFNSCDRPEQSAELMEFAAAREQILADCSALGPAETRALVEAQGRVLARDLRSEQPLPPFDGSAMDGYALRAEDSRAESPVALRVAGRSIAGHPHPEELEPGSCLRILTGAALPPGADAVVIQEAVEQQGGRILLPGPVETGANVRKAGDDLPAGAIVLEAGCRLHPARIAAAAAAGFAEVRVWRRPRVAYFTTGDELRPLGAALGPGQIYDSNRHALRALLERLDVEAIDLGRIEDRPETVRSALQMAADCSDVVLTTGGVSVGDTDYVKPAVEELGRLSLWRIAIKPGKPLAVGRIGSARFYGLPGNPVSVLVTFYQLVAPALRRLSGERDVLPLQVPALCEAPLEKRAGRTEFQRGKLRSDEQGRLWVRPAGGQGSHQISSAGAADCFIILPRESTGAAERDVVQVQPFHGLV